MRRVVLVAKRDDSTGELGLMIRGAHGYEVNSANEGLLIAHDLIEHPTLEGLGRIDDELEALGAIWMCRGRHGELNKTGAGSAHSIEANIAGDVTRMYASIYNAEAYFPFDTVTLRTRPHDHDDAFLEIIDIARKEIPSELEASGLERASNPHIYARIEDYLAAALHYMRRGARKLMRRYPGQYDANNQFWAIAEAVEPYCKPEYEGAEYVLTFGNGEARCEEKYDDRY